MKKEQKPKITVVTPLYNRANFIAEEIKSVLSQDFKDFEYLILDDGSTDNSKEIVMPFLDDPRVKYFYHKNQGEAATINWGWEMARGEYFFQSNSDDTILPGLFREMVKALDKNKEVVVAYSDFNFIDKDGKIILVTITEDWHFLELLSAFSCQAGTPGTFIRREAFKDWVKIKDPTLKYINDIKMYWDMALKGDFLRVPKILSNWRSHSDGISSKRYLSINEVEKWFLYYFSRPDLPQEVLNCKKETEKSVYEHIIRLLKDSGLTNNGELIKKYEYKLENLFEFKNLQVGDNDLIGNKFNGHDLHKYLREKGVDSNHLVWNKESKDKYTFILAGDKPNRQVFRDYSHEISKQYQLDRVYGTNAYDVIYSDLFLNADVVHYHLIHNLAFDINLLPILTKLKPTVWTIHDPWALSGHCVHHFDCDRWQTGCGDCPYLNVHFPLIYDNSALNWEIKKNAIQNSQLDVIVASKWMENLVKKSVMFKNVHLHLVPFGIDHKKFKPGNKIDIRKKLGVPKDALVLTARCDYSEFKGFDYIEYTLDNIKTNKEVYVLLMGNNIKKRNKSYKFIEYGWVKDDNLMVDIYNASDIFLMPSKVEAFGMMAIEAMSCGVLPIVLEGTALPDIVNASEAGVAVKRDKEAYRDTVQYYIDHPEEREKRAKKCLNFAIKTYGKDEYVEKIVSVYKEAMQRFKTDESTRYLLTQIKKNMQNAAVLVKAGEITETNLALEHLTIKRRIKEKLKRMALKVLRYDPFYRKLNKLSAETESYNNHLMQIERKLDDIVEKQSKENNKN